MDPNEQAGFSVELSKQIKASAERIFDACTRPDLLSKWFTTSAEVDLRVGGRYRNADHDEGEFLVINPPSELKFTWDNAAHCPGTIVEIGLQQLGHDSVELSLQHRGIKTREGSLDMRRGWSWALDSLKSFMERGVPIPHSEWEAAHRAHSETGGGLTDE